MSVENKPLVEIEIRYPNTPFHFNVTVPTESFDNTIACLLDDMNVVIQNIIKGE